MNFFLIFISFAFIAGYPKNVRGYWSPGNFGGSRGGLGNLGSFSRGSRYSGGSGYFGSYGSPDRFRGSLFGDSMGDFSSSSKLGSYGNFQSAGSALGNQRNIGGLSLNSFNNQKTSSNKENFLYSGQINANFGARNTFNGEKQNLNSLEINHSFRSKDGTGELNIASKHQGKTSSIGADLSKTISVNKQTDVNLYGGLYKKSNSDLQSYVGGGATINSPDKTGKISGTFERNNGENSFKIGAEKSSQDRTGKISGSFERNNGENSFKIGAEKSSQDRTGKISGTFERNNYGDSLGIAGEKSFHDQTGKISGSFKQNNGENAFKIEAEKSFHDQTGKISGSFERNNGENAFKIGAEKSSQDRTGKISGTFEKNEHGNSFNIKGEKSIVNNDRGNLGVYAEVHKPPFGETKLNAGVEGNLNIGDGKGKLSAGIDNNGAWDAKVGYDLHKSDSDSVSAYAGVKQNAGEDIQGQVGIQIKKKF